MQLNIAQRTFGVISQALDGDYAGLVLLAIHEVARQHGVRVLIFQGTPADVLCAGALVDGWIVVVFAEGIERLVATGKPCLTIAAVAEGSGAPAVLADNASGVQAAIAHLFNHGHRRIAFVGYRNSEDIKQRHQGYSAALAAHGLAYDPALVFDAPNDEVSGGRAAGQRMAQAGMPCSAVFAATDENAIGLLEELQSSGYQVPGQVAVASFDNVEQSQHTDPPLTTISQRPDMLGRTAALLLLRQLEGEGPPPRTYVPTALFVRRSCGCSSAIHSGVIAGAPAPARHDWHDALAHELLSLALYPAAPPPELSPQQVWPGVLTLIDGVEAVVRGRAVPTSAALSQAWAEALHLTQDLEVLHALLRRLRQAAGAHLGIRPEDPLSERVDSYLMRAQIELVRARLAAAMGQIDFLRDRVQRTYEISMQLLAGGLDEATTLAWLDGQSMITWGCLGLWSDLQGDDPASIRIVGAYSCERDVSRLVGRTYPAEAFPPPGLLPASTYGGREDVVMILPIRRHAGPLDGAAASLYHLTKQKRGVLVLCAPLDHQLSSNKLLMWSMLLSVALERGELLDSLAQARAGLG